MEGSGQMQWQILFLVIFQQMYVSQTIFGILESGNFVIDACPQQAVSTFNIVAPHPKEPF